MEEENQQSDLFRLGSQITEDNIGRISNFDHWNFYVKDGILYGEFYSNSAGKNYYIGSKFLAEKNDFLKILYDKIIQEMTQQSLEIKDRMEKLLKKINVFDLKEKTYFNEQTFAYLIQTMEEEIDRFMRETCNQNYEIKDFITIEEYDDSSVVRINKLFFEDFRIYQQYLCFKQQQVVNGFRPAVSEGSFKKYQEIWKTMMKHGLYLNINYQKLDLFFTNEFQRILDKFVNQHLPQQNLEYQNLMNEEEEEKEEEKQGEIEVSISNVDQQVLIDNNQQFDLAIDQGLQNQNKDQQDNESTFLDFEENKQQNQRNLEYFAENENESNQNYVVKGANENYQQASIQSQQLMDYDHNIYRYKEDNQVLEQYHMLQQQQQQGQEFLDQDIQDIQNQVNNGQAVKEVRQNFGTTTTIQYFQKYSQDNQQKIDDALESESFDL